MGLKLLPVIVTSVPPAVVPLSGDISSITGPEADAKSGIMETKNITKTIYTTFLRFLPIKLIITITL